MHATAFFVSIPAGATLVALADGVAQRVTASIYVVSLLTMFGMSSAYHRLAHSPAARRRMQRFDHAGIFVLITGTYVPMTLVAMPRSWGIPVLAVVATAGALGIALKLLAFDRLSLLGYMLYPLMGWAVVAAGPVLFDSLTGLQFGLVVAGGLVYTMGIPVLFLKRPDPWPATFGYHEIWHSFVVVAAALHFAAVADLLT